MRAKYIVVDRQGLESAILLPQNRGVMHAEVRVGFQRIVAAGYCEQKPDGHWTAFGRSESLDVDSRGAIDAQLLEKCYG